MKYADQLRHPNWQRKRLEILNRSGFRCEGCGSADKTMHVHHKIYHRGYMAWDYENDELAAFCESCHFEWHELEQDLRASISAMNLQDLQTLAEQAHELRGMPSVLWFMDRAAS